MTETPLEPGTPLPDVDTVGLFGLLPHRAPFLLVDRLVDLKAFESAVGIKAVSFGEPFFAGHFPGDPIMPGVLIVEAMAQTAAALVALSRQRAGRNNMVYFMGIDEARFRRPVRPGCVLRLEVSKQRQRLGFWRFAGRAVVDDDLAAEAVFAAKLIDN